jgi:hypothetical protein
MITDRIKALETARAKVAKLEAQIAAQRNAALAQLPAKYGFSSVNEFVAAVKAAAATTGVTGNSGKRRRVKITDATKAEVKKLIEAGRTGAEIAKAVGISLPSVHNIKKALGLVQKRGRARAS